MKWLAATALTTAMVMGFFTFEGGALAQTSSTSGGAAQSRSVDSLNKSQGQPAAGTPDRTGQSGFQGNQPPNVTSSGPNANAPAANSAAGSASMSGSASGSASMSGTANNSTGTGGAISNRSTTTGSAATGGRTSSGAASSSTTTRRAGTSSQMGMSSGSMSGKKTARKSSTRARSGSAGSSRSHSMGMASRSRDSGDRATSALNWLSASGYRDVKELRPQGGMFVATVNKDGRTQQVTVDPSNGRIQPAS